MRGFLLVIDLCGVVALERITYWVTSGLNIGIGF